MQKNKLKIILLILFLITTFVFNSLFSFLIGDSGDKKIQWVNHTNEVIIETKDYLSAMKDTETGQRGYLLTKKTTYLEPYYSGLIQADKSFHKLKKLTSDNPIQQNRLNSIKILMKLKLAELKQTIDLANNNKAIELVKKDIGKKYMDEIRVILNDFTLEEENLLVKRKAEFKEYSSKTFLIVQSVSFILLIILFYFIYINFKQKDNLKRAIIKAEESLVVKSEFLANMSHEIRTPLNAILGFISLLKDITSDNLSIKYLNIISSSSQSLLNIIEDILDFSKIESGKLEIDKIDFNTKTELEIISHLFDAKCSEKNITLILNIDKDIPTYLNTDPLRIKQIISNLLSNAVKFTDAGKKIFVTIDYVDDNLIISIKDEGKGIAKDKQEHIFTAFGQEDTSTTRNYGGTGLGLSICTSLVSLLDGKLELKSELGIGSEFIIHIPASIADSCDKDKKIADELIKLGNVLLVEDNKTNQMFMTIVLEELNLEFDIANDGLEAIEKFKNNNYYVVLMDENMPNMGGIEATAKILEYEKENNLKHTPIIALTANALKGDREKFLAAGMDEYRTKPLDKATLIEVINKVSSK